MSLSMMMGKGVMPCSSTPAKGDHIRPSISIRNRSRGQHAPVLRRKTGRMATTTPHALLATQPTAGVEVALDFYKLLQVSHVASRETATRAYDRCISNPPEVGYSQQTLLTRGAILKGALDTLLDTSSRKDYDDRLLVGDVVEEVPPEYVAGALALLQEAGEANTVVALGSPWLEAHRKDKAAKDVALAVALAECDVAQAALEGQGDVMQSVSRMESALRLLRQYRPGSKLQQEIEGAVQELQPQLAVALLSLPLDAVEPRSRGLAAAEGVLQGGVTGKGLTLSGRNDFVQQLAGHLTATEQVRLYETCGSAFAETPAELYTVALAYIVQGAGQFHPAALQKAAELLLLPSPLPPEGPEGQRERRAGEERNRRAVALAVCFLLLGDSAAAEAALGISPGGSGPPKCDRTVVQFIKSNSPNRTDLLPGLCVLAQRWIHDVAFGSFRVAEDSEFSLNAWFASPKVQKAIKIFEQGGNLEDASRNPVIVALSEAMALLSAPLAKGLAMGLALVGLLDNGESRTAEQLQQPKGQHAQQATSEADSLVDRGDKEDISNVDMGHSRQTRQEAWGEVPTPAQPVLQATSSATAASEHLPESQPSNTSSQSVTNGSGAQAPEWGRDVSTPSSHSAAPSAPRNTNGSSSAGPQASTRGRSSKEGGPAAAKLPPRQRPAKGAVLSSSNVAASAVVGAGARLAVEDVDLEEFASEPIALPVQLAGEEWMLDAYQARYVRWGRIVIAALMLGGAVLLGGATVMRIRALLVPSGSVVAVLADMAPDDASSAADEEAVAVETADASAQDGADVAADADAAPAEVVVLSEKDATVVIKHWQEIKSEALGPKHAVGKLDKVLTGSILDQWKERAKIIKELGWHYSHTLERCTVDSVAVGSTPGSVVVKASFREVAELHKKGEEPQTYRSDYSVLYELVKVKKDWKISEAILQY